MDITPCGDEYMDCLNYDPDCCDLGDCASLFIEDQIDWQEYNEYDTPYSIEYQEWVRPQKKEVSLTFTH